MKNFNVILRENAEYSEVVDTISDVFEVGIAIEGALSDGFQLNDVLVAVQQEPKIREVVNDIQVFFGQFVKLTPSTAVSAVLEAKARIESQGKLGRVGEFIFGVLYNLASGFGFVDNTIVGGQQQINNWRLLVAGTSPIPQT